MHHRIKTTLAPWLTLNDTNRIEFQRIVWRTNRIGEFMHYFPNLGKLANYGSFRLNILGNLSITYESNNREFVYEGVDIVRASLSNGLATFEVYHPHLGYVKYLIW